MGKGGCGLGRVHKRRVLSANGPQRRARSGSYSAWRPIQNQVIVSPSQSPNARWPQPDAGRIDGLTLADPLELQARVVRVGPPEGVGAKCLLTDRVGEPGQEFRETPR